MEAIVTTQPTSPIAEVLARPARPTPPHILIVEDEEDLRRLYGRALRGHGYEVSEARSLRAARDMLNRGIFDALLCDIHIGDGRGTDLLREYRGRLAAAGTTIMLISGEAQHLYPEFAHEFFLEKPISIQMLLTLLDRLFPSTSDG